MGPSLIICPGCYVVSCATVTRRSAPSRLRSTCSGVNWTSTRLASSPSFWRRPTSPTVSTGTPRECWETRSECASCRSCYKLQFIQLPLLSWCLQFAEFCCLDMLKDFEALMPNLLARTIETVEGGGLIILLLSSLSSLTSFYTMVMVSFILHSAPLLFSIRVSINQGTGVLVDNALSVSFSTVPSSAVLNFIESCCSCANRMCMRGSGQNLIARLPRGSMRGSCCP
jgi:hypothetical protein